MKKYNTLGELLIDYREDNDIAQADFAANINVDIRTVQRWEKDITLIKPEKEEEIVMETLLPYQLIRNLNAIVAIPTYFDFKLRKYSLTELTNKLPRASWFKDQLNISTKRIRTIDFDFDLDYIFRFLKLKKNRIHLIDKEVIKEAIRLLPEANVIITDDSGYYSGHNIMFPLTKKAFKKLENREISKEQLSLKDLSNYKTQDPPIIFNFDLTADCNDNLYYLVSCILNFMQNSVKENYIYCAAPNRHDSYEVNEETGLEIVWREEDEKDPHLRFHKGNFTEFLSS